MSTPPGGRVRRATRADLPAVYDIWYRTETLDDDEPPPKRLDDPTYRDELEHDDLVVFERAGDGTLLGFAASERCGPVRFLVDLFVEPDAQSSGVGRALLSMAMPADGLPLVTFSSSDPRALALYVRAGMRPRWPQYYLSAPSSALRIARDGGIEVRIAEPDDPELARWDLAASGQPRGARLDYWFEELSATALWVSAGGTTIGYALALYNPNALRTTDWLDISPAGAGSPEDAVRVVLAAAGWARDRAPGVQIVIPGPHAALPALLEAGMKITDWDTLCSSTAELPFDPRRYLCGMNTL